MSGSNSGQFAFSAAIPRSSAASHLEQGAPNSLNCRGHFWIEPRLTLAVWNASRT